MGTGPLGSISPHFREGNGFVRLYRLFRIVRCVTGKGEKDSPLQHRSVSSPDASLGLAASSEGDALRTSKFAKYEPVK
jgi:hypothetical protein